MLQPTNGVNTKNVLCSTYPPSNSPFQVTGDWLRPTRASRRILQNMCRTRPATLGAYNAERRVNWSFMVEYLEVCRILVWEVKRIRCAALPNL